jgi:uncharacterized membrane protein
MARRTQSEQYDIDSDRFTARERDRFYGHVAGVALAVIGIGLLWLVRHVNAWWTEL